MRRIILLILLFTAGLASAQEEPVSPELPPENPVPVYGIDPIQVPRLETYRVIVGVNANFVPEGQLRDTFSIQSQRDNIYFAQQSVLSSLNQRGYATSSYKLFQTIPYIALKVDANGLEALHNDPNVTSITVDNLNYIYDNPADYNNNLVGVPTAWDYGFDGAGVAVAIFDTGLEPHPATDGRVIAEACFNTTGDTGFTTCPNGEDVDYGPGASRPTVTDRYHGQHVTGTVAGSEPAADFYGIARGADIISVNVFTRFDNGNDGAWDSDLMEAMEWVYTLRDHYTISAINMSLGGGRFYNACDSFNPAMYDIVNQLKDAHIAVIAASGNSGYVDSMGFPACISSIISVGSVQVAGTGSGLQDDVVSSFSNRASFLDLMAPGQRIWSAIPTAIIGDGYYYLNGTSMAAPHVTGLFGILRQAYPASSVDDLLHAAKTTGATVDDTSNGYTFPRMQVDAALNMPPGDAVAISPHGGIFTELPAFTWHSNPYANYYLINVLDETATTIVTDMTVNGCPTLTCTGLLTTTLAGGSYTWTVTAYNPMGVPGASTTPLPFVIETTDDGGGDDGGDDSGSNDGSNGDNSGTDTSSGGEANASPIAVTDSYSTPFGTSLIVDAATGVLSNDTDADTDPLTAVLDSTTEHGTLSLHSDGSLIYTPDIAFAGSDSFTYHVSDGMANSASTTVTIVTELPPVSQTPALLTINGLTSFADGPSVVSWTHYDGNNTETVPGAWYNVVIEGTQGIVFDHWFQTNTICTRLLCIVVLDGTLLPGGLLNGDYLLRVRAWANEITGDFSDDLPFVVEMPVPLFQSGLSVQPNQGRPSLILENDPGALWYQVYIGSETYQHMQWYPRSSTDCGALTCTLHVDAHPQNGTYQVWLQSWGPAGFSTGGNFAVWAGPFEVIIDFNAPPVMEINAVTAIIDGDAVLTWHAPAGATWFNVWVGTADYSQTHHFDWHAALELGCGSGSICTLTLPDTFIGSQTYIWFVRSWGPGGFSTGGDFSGWSQGTAFNG